MSVREKVLPFKEGQSIESRSFQSGYRGAWFRCKIKSTDRRRNGSFGYDLEYMDFPDEKTTWTKAYQKNIANDKKARHQKPSELMIRPSFPLVYREGEMPDVSSISEVVVIVNDVWKVGDLIDWWSDGCFWSGSITQLQENNLFQILLLPYPSGEGLAYTDCRKEDLRPSLNWSLEYGWTVPTPTESDHTRCARLVHPIRPGKVPSSVTLNTVDNTLRDSQSSFVSHDSSDSTQPRDRSKNQKGQLLVSKPTKTKHIAGTSTGSGSKNDPVGQRSNFPDSDSSSRVKPKSAEDRRGTKSPSSVPRPPSRGVETDGDSSRSNGPSESIETGEGASIGKAVSGPAPPSEEFENVENETREMDVDSDGSFESGEIRSDGGGCVGPAEEGREEVKLALNSDSSDTVEASILDLEELLQRVKWMKGSLRSGKASSSDFTKPPWKFLEHSGSSTPK